MKEKTIRHMNPWTDLLQFAGELENIILNQRLFVDNDMGTLQLILPGYDKEEISVKIEGDSLIVSCDKEFPKEEYWKKKFKRVYTLSGMVDRNSVKAELKNGILTVKIAKDKAKTTKVNVE